MPVALRAVAVPTVDLRAEAGVAADVRLPTTDLPAVDVVRVLLGALAFLAAVLRTVLPDDAVEPLPADRVVGAVREPAVAFVVALPAAVFFVARLAVVDFAARCSTAVFRAAAFVTAAFFEAFFAGTLLAVDVLLAFFATGLDAGLRAPVLLVDLRGVLVAMRVSRRMRRRPAAARIR